ncbi:hypothetical protein J6590_038657 [Homalodisca vitripennis]|nr:hypothetical protein J6590_038657 [Homalodisca vitripennis]
MRISPVQPSFLIFSNVYSACVESRLTEELSQWPAEVEDANYVLDDVFEMRPVTRRARRFFKNAVGTRMRCAIVTVRHSGEGAASSSILEPLAVSQSLKMEINLKKNRRNPTKTLFMWFRVLCVKTIRPFLTFIETFLAALILSNSASIVSR